MTLKQWVKMPVEWVNDGRLQTFKWIGGDGPSCVAALMAYSALLHQMNPETGLVQRTYDELCKVCSISRSKLSFGLRLLEDRGMISKTPHRYSKYSIENYNPEIGWAMFPAKGLYSTGAISAFKHFHLRNITELDALKLYFLFAARRDRNTNMAHLTYDHIEEKSDVPRARIKSALSMLAANALVHIEHLPSKHSQYGSANAYRLAHLHPNFHMGTQGRAALQGA